MLDRITPVIVTLNEEPNIGRTLERLRWAKRIVVVDANSSDATEQIARSFPQVSMVRDRFENHAAQWNRGLDEAVDAEWVLALDADYSLSDGLIEEMRSLQPADQVHAYQAQFDYVIRGRPMKASLYPAKPVLFRRRSVRFIQDGHTQRPVVSGAIAELHHHIAHDDRKPLKTFLRNQDRYMTLEARKIRTTSFQNLSWSGRVRKLIFVAPPAVLLFTLFGRGTILDGWRGVYYAMQRTLAESILSLKLIEEMLGTSANR
jgi:glycosyltransferase involved in cell wall biosynthesis